MLITMFMVFLFSVFIGLPLFLSLLSTALVGFCFIDPSMITRIMPQQFFGRINAFSLMAIPLFIFAGNLMNASGMTDMMLRLARQMVGHLRGGMGYVNVVASVFFSGVNGSAVADASALGPLMIPAMEKEGYSRQFAAGLTAGSSLIGPIIPPSIFMIIYASLTNTSVGDLFLGGVIPGLIIGSAFMIMNFIHVRRHNILRGEGFTNWHTFFSVLLYALPALVAPVIIVAGIVVGFVTPTESAALTVLYVALYGILLRKLKLQEVLHALVETTKLTCAIFLIMAAAAQVSWLLSYAQAPNQFLKLLEPFAHHSILILLLICLITFITGMFMEEVSALMLLTPVFMPIAQVAGIDPVHLGIIITLNITIALITPPMGACLYVVSAVGKLAVLDMFKSIWPFIIMANLVLLLLIVFPDFVTWLPSLFH